MTKYSSLDRAPVVRRTPVPNHGTHLWFLYCQHGQNMESPLSMACQSARAFSSGPGTDLLEKLHVYWTRGG